MQIARAVAASRRRDRSVDRPSSFLSARTFSSLRERERERERSANDQSSHGVCLRDIIWRNKYVKERHEDTLRPATIFETRAETGIINELRTARNNGNGDPEMDTLLCSDGIRNEDIRNLCEITEMSRT